MAHAVARRLVLGFCAIAVAWPALAQSPPIRVRGVIERVAGPEISIVTREGSTIAVRLAETARLSAVVKASLADVKPGAYVGIAAVPQPDGTQRALEVLIFPEAMRGAGEGHRPWDLMPKSTMTNATVAETVAKVEGRAIVLNYKDGSKTIVVPPDVAIVTFAPAASADVRPGIRVFTTVTRAADGTNTTASLVVGRDGVDPPM